jgi:hypothetical protein
MSTDLNSNAANEIVRHVHFRESSRSYSRSACELTCPWLPSATGLNKPAENMTLSRTPLGYLYGGRFGCDCERELI